MRDGIENTMQVVTRTVILPCGVVGSTIDMNIVFFRQRYAGINATLDFLFKTMYQGFILLHCAELYCATYTGLRHKGGKVRKNELHKFFQRNKNTNICSYLQRLLGTLPVTVVGVLDHEFYSFIDTSHVSKVKKSSFFLSKPPNRAETSKKIIFT